MNAAALINPLRHLTPPLRLAERTRERTFATREARMMHIAQRCESGWRLRPHRDEQGRCWVRLDYGRVFRVREVIAVSAREFGYYGKRQCDVRHFV